MKFSFLRKFISFSFSNNRMFIKHRKSTEGDFNKRMKMTNSCTTFQACSLVMKSHIKHLLEFHYNESFFFLILFLNFIVLVLPNIEMNPPQVYMCSPSWTLLPPSSPYHPSGSSQCTSPKHPVSWNRTSDFSEGLCIKGTVIPMW